ncbi:MAG TPA: FAD-binding oxidoreductase [Bacillota bacterium]|nr:FAD-binding oxidoreductase [Bacillota bacterium]
MQTTAILDLKKHFTGEVIEPGDALYDEARTVLMKEGSPLVALWPKTPADVSLAVRFAADNSLVLSVRSGGHSNGGLSTNDDGVIIDTRHLDGVELLDEAKHLVRLGAGLTWGEAAKALQEYGLALSSGDTRTVAVGGLAVGAGIGWMVRKYGLTIDSLVAAEVVTADGSILRVSDSEHSDLFWAIRGGGGNFGIVTSFDFVAHPVAKVFAGSIVFSRDHFKELLTGWRDVMRAAPEELTTMFLAMPSFGGNPPAAMVLCCYAGDDKDAAMKAIDPLLQLDKPLKQDIAEKAYGDVLEDAHPPKGMRIVVNNIFIKDFSEDVINLVANQPDSIFQIRSVGGAMNRVSKDATAFPHRDSEVLVISPTFLPPDATDADIARALQPWDKIEAHGSGAYASFYSDITDKHVAAAFPGATYKRLAEIKAKYDPNNLFNQNCNIKPAV